MALPPTVAAVGPIAAATRPFRYDCVTSNSVQHGHARQHSDLDRYQHSGVGKRDRNRPGGGSRRGGRDHSEVSLFPLESHGDALSSSESASRAFGQQLHGSGTGSAAVPRGGYAGPRGRCPALPRCLVV